MAGENLWVILPSTGRVEGSLFQRIQPWTVSAESVKLIWAVFWIDRIKFKPHPNVLGSTSHRDWWKYRHLETQKTRGDSRFARLHGYTPLLRLPPFAFGVSLRFSHMQTSRQGLEALLYIWLYWKMTKNWPHRPPCIGMLSKQRLPER